MAGRDASQQIRQMSKFIKLEADEKAQEIQMRTEHDCARERQTRVHQGKAELRKQFRRMEAELAQKARVEASKLQSAQRGSKLAARDGMLKSLLDEAKARMATLADRESAKYNALLVSLLVESATSLRGGEVGPIAFTVRCRSKDVAAVEKAAAAAVGKLQELAEAEKVPLGENTFSVDRERPVADATGGGVVVSSTGNRIVCNNTLTERLRLSFAALEPALKAVLFPDPVVASAETAAATGGAAAAADMPDLLG